MEFSTGRRRDGFYINGDEKQVEGSKQASFFTLSSSSSSVPSASAAFGWHVGPSDDGAAGDGRNGGGNFFEEKEHMFDKVVTPSDVGKLNRLVIPKQHAERYFPLDTAANEKGLLLSFEDRTGKSWRFRYSYWNSSQSYVMTKGWSRFVKEKRLDAGDVVSFGRGVGESGRDHLYIDWKPRPMEIINHDMPRLPPVLAPLAGVSMARPVGAWGSGRFIITPGAVYDHHHPGFGYNAMNSSTTGGGHIHFFRPSMAGPPQIGVQHDGGGGGGLPVVLNSLPLVGNQAEAKRVRLFGVNLDCAEAAKGNAHLPNGLCPSARHLQSISSTSTLPFLPFPSIDQSSMASSSQEQHLTLDLGL